MLIDEVSFSWAKKKICGSAFAMMDVVANQQLDEL